MAIQQFPLGLNHVSLVYNPGTVRNTSQFTGVTSVVGFGTAETWQGDITYSNHNDPQKIMAYSAMRSEPDPVFRVVLPNPYPKDPAHDLFPTITLVAVGDIERAGYREIWFTLNADLLTQFLIDNADSPHIRRREYYEDKMRNLSGHYMEFTQDGRLFQIGRKILEETGRTKYRVNPGMRILDAVAPKGGDEVGVRIDRPSLVCSAVEPLPYSYALGGIFESNTIEVVERIIPGGISSGN